jgi:hypothetical protein
VTEFFPGRSRDGEASRALRVSRYFADEGREAEVRFSVWRDVEHGDMRADAAVSLDEPEAERLLRFLAEVPAPDETQTL